MPKTTEERRHCPAEKAFPQGKARHHPQIIPQPQVSPADAEEGEKPADHQLQADPHPGQPGEPPSQGAQKIRRRAQQHPAENTTQEPGSHQLRLQRRSPRLCRGSG